MGIDYVLIASILMYAGVVRLFDRFGTGIVFSAFAAVLGPFFFELFLKLIFVMGYDLPLSGLIRGGVLILLALQLLAACGIFYRLDKNEGNIAGWFGWAVGGAFILFFGLPFVVGKFMSI